MQAVALFRHSTLATAAARDSLQLQLHAPPVLLAEAAMTGSGVRPAGRRLICVSTLVSPSTIGTGIGELERGLAAGHSQVNVSQYLCIQQAPCRSRWELSTS